MTWHVDRCMRLADAPSTLVVECGCALNLASWITMKKEITKNSNLVLQPWINHFTLYVVCLKFNIHLTDSTQKLPLTFCGKTHSVERLGRNAKKLSQTMRIWQIMSYNIHVCIFSDILEWNKDYSDTLEIKLFRHSRNKNYSYTLKIRTILTPSK